MDSLNGGAPPSSPIPWKPEFFLNWTEEKFFSLGQDEWRLHEPPKEEPGGPEEHDRELTQLFPEVWVKDKPPSLQAG